MTEMQQSNDTFADRLKQLRKAADLSQYGLSKATDIDQAVISRYENGLTPHAEHVTRLANFFEVDFSQFVTDPVISEITELVLRLPQPKRVEVLEFTRFKTIAA